jgi:branched-chain amino acid transport system substrate-binding protein
VFNKDLLASASVPKPAQWSTDSYTMTYYDSVVVMALAATLTKSTSPAVFNKDVMTVTAPGSGKTVVTSFAAGKAALAAGKRIQYVGAAGVIDFNKWHNSGGGFEIAAYKPNGDLTPVNTITAANLAPLIK